ncbi:Aspartic proteinase nepenthesin-2 [Thalictrum thalictroides]|uniref:Aspartic proteinase nepenthesin-2 n=1 Tax=Thalictrum thalictroides TaxID=46969 RepID=A0A7J6WZS3_THATH|nr:Aspartic proteinase nepenthesin-2 [Thalictrum thalictroides]
MVLLLLLQLVISKSNGFTLKLIHRDSIESPLYPGNLTLEERATRLLHIQTDARIKYYAKKIAIAASAKLQNMRPGNKHLAILARIDLHLRLIMVPLIIFGCGTNQEMRFETTPNKINGILGMGSGPHSLISQLGYRAQKRFSYCIPSRQNDNDNIYLRFGQEAAFRHGQQVHHLHFPPGYFDIRHDGSGGCVIDSGSPLTSLPQGAYIWLKNVVTQYFAQMQLPTKQKPHFDLCFPVPGPHQPFPLITFHFANADLQVGTTAFVGMDDAICLAFRSSGELGGISAIIGGLVQSYYRFVFNLATSTVSFAIEDCRRTS